MKPITETSKFVKLAQKANLCLNNLRPVDNFGRVLSVGLATYLSVAS